MQHTYKFVPLKDCDIPVHKRDEMTGEQAENHIDDFYVVSYQQGMNRVVLRVLPTYELLLFRESTQCLGIPSFFVKSSELIADMDAERIRLFARMFYRAYGERN